MFNKHLLHYMRSSNNNNKNNTSNWLDSFEIFLIWYEQKKKIIRITLSHCLPRHLGTAPLHEPLDSHSKLGGPLKRYPHEHLKTALPHADVFSSVKLKCGSSKYNDGHWTGLHVGGGDDQLPAINAIQFNEKNSFQMCILAYLFFYMLCVRVFAILLCIVH